MKLSRYNVTIVSKQTTQIFWTKQRKTDTCLRKLTTRFHITFLGTVCSLMGDDAKAVSYFAKAVALGRATGSENLPTFMVNLGMAKLKLGLKSDANAICHDAYQMAKKDDLSEVCQEAQECLNLAGKQ